MRIVQFEIPGQGRRIGIVDGDGVRDLTSVRPAWRRTIDVFNEADESNQSFHRLLADAAQRPGVSMLDYRSLLNNEPGSDVPFLHPAVDTADLHRVLITGTGLTHLGSMQSRNQMHADPSEDKAGMTDSAKMFAMGIRGGKPPVGQRGVALNGFIRAAATTCVGIAGRWSYQDSPAMEVKRRNLLAATSSIRKACREDWDSL